MLAGALYIPIASPVLLQAMICRCTAACLSLSLSLSLSICRYAAVHHTTFCALLTPTSSFSHPVNTPQPLINSASQTPGRYSGPAMPEGCLGLGMLKLKLNILGF